MSVLTLNLSFQAVTPKMVRDICCKYIYDKCPAVAAVGEFCCTFSLFTARMQLMLQLFSVTCPTFSPPGPIEQLPDYNRMRSAMYWLRF